MNTNNVSYKFALNEPVLFYSPDNQKLMKGTIQEVDISLTMQGTSTNYTIEADEEIKQSRQHMLDDSHDFIVSQYMPLTKETAKQLPAKMLRLILDAMEDELRELQEKLSVSSKFRAKFINLTIEARTSTISVLKKERQRRINSPQKAN
jgi:hypothetical protein